MTDSLTKETSPDIRLAPFAVCPGCGGVFNKTRDGAVPRHFIDVSAIHRFECTGSLKKVDAP